MRILILSTCYPRHSQPNSGIFIHRQTVALSKLGVECHVIQPVDWAPPAPLHRLYSGWKMGRRQQDDARDSVDGIPVHHPRVFYPVPSRFFPGDAWERAGHAVARYIERDPVLRRADLLVAHFLCHEGYAGLIASNRLGIPLVGVARGDDIHAWPERWPDRVPKLSAVMRHARGLVACSAGLARDAEAWATDGIGTPFEVVYNGVDTRLFTPICDANERRASRERVGLPLDRRIVLSVATPIDLKGWPELLTAFSRLAPGFDDWTLAMTGAPRGADDLDLVVEAAARGIGDRVTWLGQMAPELMPDLYRAADVFVLASRNEGLSNAVVEAMATGLPVVATRVGGHGEVIDDGVDGRLVPPCDEDALVEAMRELMSDGHEMDRMGRAARARAERHGDFTANARHFVSYLQRCIDEQTRSPRAVHAESAITGTA